MNQPKRNDPCWCGSGKKYKKCHLREDQDKNPENRQLSATPTVLPGKISPKRTVPIEIPRPEYADSGQPIQKQLSCKKTSSEQIDSMRKAGLVARTVLDTVLAAVTEGITTDELDEIAHNKAIELGGYPSPLNYIGFPKSICTSINEVVVHGIPDSRKLKNGDIVNCDVTVFSHGMHGDCSETVFVGKVDAAAKKLVQVTWECLLKGLEVVRPGAPFNEIGKVIEAHAHKHHYSVVRDFSGHGIGAHFHMVPNVAHFYDRSNKLIMEEGMTFTIEPMINAGTLVCKMWEDNWTAVTKDFSRSAQFEHTILVTADGYEILTGGTTPFFEKR